MKMTPSPPVAARGARRLRLGRGTGRRGPCGGGGGAARVAPGERREGLGVFLFFVCHGSMLQGFVIDVLLHHIKLYMYFSK